MRRPGKGLRAVIALVALLALVLALASPSVPSASAGGTGTRWSVTIFGEPFPAGGTPFSRAYLPSDSTLRVGSDASQIVAIASPDVGGDWAQLFFAAPPGETLVPGLYEGATRSFTPGHPWISVDYDGHGCSTPTGRFDVRDLHRSSAGKIDRVWILFESRCDHGAIRDFGELRYGEPPSSDSIDAIPGAIWFPDTYVGVAGTTVPVTIEAGPHGAAVSDVHLAGPAKADIKMGADGCTGVMLAPGERCEVWLTPQPLTPGPRIARLVVTSDTVTRIPIDVAALGLATSVALNGDPGDWIVDGESLAFDPSNGIIDAWGDQRTVLGYVIDVDGVIRTFGFDAGVDTTLSAGSTILVDGDPFPYNGDAAGLLVSGNGSTCSQTKGSFTVNRISFLPSGELQDVSLDFTQHCDHLSPALRGEIRFRIPGPDEVGPAAPTGITVARSPNRRHATVTWTDPPVDVAYTVIRFLQSARAPGDPDAGWPGYAGSAQTAIIRHLNPRRGLTISVFEVDTSGNLSAPATVQS